jgi:hypothetical protein
MKGQSSIEFLIFVSILFLIFAFILWNDNSLQNQLNWVKTNTEAKNVCDGIAFEINSAVRTGNGYKRKFYVEKDFFGVSDFDISVGNYTVYIDWSKNSVSSSIITENITGIVDKGSNFIENRNGEIYVTQP